jgi:choline dehydrogenase
MLSGIGPAAQLSRHNIPVVLDAPGVGANLLDHPTVPLRLKEKTGKSFNHLMPYNMRTTCLFMRDLCDINYGALVQFLQMLVERSLRSHTC